MMFGISFDTHILSSLSIFSSSSSSSSGYNSFFMEVLPSSSVHFIRSSQASVSPSESFACDRNGHRFKLPNFISPVTTSPNVIIPPKKKDKVVFVLGTTGAGKSKLAIDLAAHFGGEVVNSDKMQVYSGLDIITNKVTVEECAGIPHHLIGGVHPDDDYTKDDFCREATRAVESIIANGRLPIVAGGSNSYIEELVEGDLGKFRSMFDCCFVWIDVQLPVLHAYVDERVDKMVEMGLVDEARGIFEPEADYSRGIRRSIGVPELDQFFRAERSGGVEQETKARMVRDAIGKIKENTRKLTCRQLEKIRRLSTLAGWSVPRIDATEAFEKRGDGVGAEQAWRRAAREPSIKIVERFLMGDLDDDLSILKKMIDFAAADHAKETSEAIGAAEHKAAPAMVGATRWH